MLFFLGKIELELPKSNGVTPDRIPSQFLPIAIMILAVAAVLTTLIVCWAVFIRKPKQVKASSPRLASPAPAVTETDDGRLRVRKKHRKRRRDHRGRNPTLAETGGLPEGNSPPSSPS
jgi:hypothetical protein